MEVRVLGPVEMIGAGGVGAVGGDAAPLLAALVVERASTRSVDVLVGALWSERAPKDAAKALQLYVSRLRKTLPEQIRFGPGARDTRLSSTRSCWTRPGSSGC